MLPDMKMPIGMTTQSPEPSVDDAPLTSLLAEAAARHAGQVAIDDGHAALTYAAVWGAALRMQALLDRRAPQGRPVAVLLANTAHYPVAWMGCLLGARPALLLDSHYPAERNRQCLREGAPAAVIARRDDPTLPDHAPGLPVIAIEEAFAPDPITPPPHPAPNDSPAFIIFTSGSTGQPKGIALGARAMRHRAATLIGSVGMRPDDAVLSLVPPCALGGVLNVLETFLAGATLRKLDLPRSSLTLHAGKRITMLFATPALLRVLDHLDENGALRAGLRCVQPIGDSLLQADLRQLRSQLPKGCAILNAYGSSEALVSLQWFVSDPYDRPGTKVASGYPVPGYTCAITDADGRPCAVEEAGDLVVRSRYMALGEWRAGQLAPGPFQPDPDDPGSFIHRTGDLAIRAADGMITVLGRRDRQVKIRGNRVEPAELEEFLRTRPGVREAAVVARRDAEDPVLFAFIVAGEDAPADLRDQSAAALVASFPSYMCPSAIIALPALPLLPGGKVDEAALLASVPRPQRDGRRPESPDHTKI
jgi:acyl-coenzyme A synthetase/AMP-(fatty) acid ligase